jgi:hypothetical protein
MGIVVVWDKGENFSGDTVDSCKGVLQRPDYSEHFKRLLFGGVNLEITRVSCHTHVDGSIPLRFTSTWFMVVENENLRR